MPTLTPVHELVRQLNQGEISREGLSLIIGTCERKSTEAYRNGDIPRGNAFHCQAEAIAHILMG